MKKSAMLRSARAEYYETTIMVSLTDTLKVLIGEKLSSVTFVLDYWQLDFDGYGFNVMSAISVTTSGQTVRSDEPGFRDRLCDQIAKIVVDATFEANEGVLITFSDGSSIMLSARLQDYRGPEAMIFRPLDKAWWVVCPDSP